MKRAPLLLTLGIVLIAALGYFAYQYFVATKKYTQWDFIPDQTVLVYEVGDCADCISSIQQSPMWQIYQTLLSRFPAEDSVTRLMNFLSVPKLGQLVSLHVTQKDDFDFLFYLPERQVLQAEGFNKILNGNVAPMSQRELNGEQINEIRIKQKVFTWVILEGFWIGSYTPFLVEDVIRTYTSKTKSEFLGNISGVSQLPRIKNDAGNIFVNHDRFLDWLSVFLERRPGEFEDFGQSSLFDIKQSTNSITVNGFSMAPATESFLSMYQDQTPVPGVMKQYISDRTMVALVHGISDGALLYDRLDISRNTGDRDSRSRLISTDVQTLYSSLGKEIAVCYLEGRLNTITPVVALESTDVKSWLEYFGKLAELSETEDTLFYEQYSTYEIREVELHDLPGKLFSPLVSGFDRTYYASVGSTIVMAPKLEELKFFLDDIDNEEVWGKSVSYNKFLESTLLESNFSVFVNTPRIWSSLSSRLSPKWRNFVGENQRTLESLDFGAIQFSHLNESFYTNILWTYLDESGRSGPTITPEEKIIANLGHKLLKGPFIIRNHASKQDEIIVQDSLFNVYQLDARGKAIWRVALNGPIIGEVHQIDYFKNSKLQLFFATEGMLHIIDRLGRYVEPFPQTIKATDIQFTEVVDYDKSKNYRFMVTDKKGKLWLFDRGGDNLEGWRPRSVEETLSAAASHHRVRGKDFMTAIRTDGWAYVMNRRGEDVRGFPLNLDSRPVGDYHLEIGNNLSTTYFTIVSRDGFRVKFNIEGKIINKETLIKPTIDTQFKLVEGMNGNGYVICRQDDKNLSILNESLEEIARNEYIGKSQAKVQYYDFGSGRVFVVLTDLSQELSYVYDGSGTLRTRIPLEGIGVELRLDEAGKPKVYVANENRVIIQGL